MCNPFESPKENDAVDLASVSFPLVERIEITPDLLHSVDAALRSGPSLIIRIAAGFTGLLVTLIGGALAFATLGSTNPNPGSELPFFGFLTCIAIFMLSYAYAGESFLQHANRKRLLKRSKEDGEVIYEIHQEGLRIRSKSGETAIPWEEVRHFRDHNGVLLFLPTSGKLWYFVPIAHFGWAAQSATIQLVLRHIEGIAVPGAGRTDV